MLIGQSITVDHDGLGFGSVHGLATVVRMVDFPALKNIKVILKELAFKEEKIQYIEGLDLLITFSDHDTAAKFIKEGSVFKVNSKVMDDDDGVDLGSQPPVNDFSGEADMETNEGFDQDTFETVGNSNDGNDNLDINGINEEEIILEVNDEEFIPAVDFPFEQNNEVHAEENVPEEVIPEDVAGPQLNTHVNKRKKFKKEELGRPSVGYTSSQESLKVTKRSKNDEDLFGIDKLLGLSDSQLDQVGDEPVHRDGPIGREAFDLNSQPTVPEQLPAEPNGPIGPVQESDEVNNNLIEQLRCHEVDQTVILGAKLGADLSSCEKMICDVVIQEGLQSGKP
ncbi:hypothetical protein L1987_22973 [Smallanthus sonchifolius]|uniref:Uncharacterized protein n=1 Tax=Smallanthus sonchifolius TaxID=185202 RepID=A0ACB9IFL9_9ASTR|nr:hypothetical protein L1987_22973 [Smallanthus sonchifolius]